MRMKKPAHPGKLVAANLKELGLSVVEAAKAVGVIRQQLYNVINGRSEVTPEMAVRVAFGGGAVWLRMQAVHDLGKARQKQEKITVRHLARGRYDGSHFRPALVDGVADRTMIDTARTLIAALMKYDSRAWGANAYRGNPRFHRCK